MFSKSNALESLSNGDLTRKAGHWQSLNEASSRSEQGRRSSRPLSVNCPSCNSPWILEAEVLREEPEDAHTRTAHRTTQPPLVARKISETSQYRTRDPSPFSFEPAASLASFEHRRRRSSSLASDSSSQTRVEGSLSTTVSGPTLRSILSGASSVSSGKVTLAGKRSVKFSEEPVYYDYSYRQSCDCEQELHHSPYCKIPYDCEGECLFDTGYYDFDMFSFEQTAAIPSVKKWGILSRLIAWIRRKRGKRVCVDSEKGRIIISRPYALGPQLRGQGSGRVIYGRGRGIVKRGRDPRRPQAAVLRSRARLPG